MKPKILKQMNPKSLEQIWCEVKQPYFRVRNTDTLEDYIVLGIKQWAQGKPLFATASKCEEFLLAPYSLPCSLLKWVLLSTKEEIQSYLGLNDKQVCLKVKGGLTRAFMGR